MEKRSTVNRATPGGNDRQHLVLNIPKGEVSPFEVSHVRSSYFGNELTFPEGMDQFDNVLPMTTLNKYGHRPEASLFALKSGL